MHSPSAPDERFADWLDKRLDPIARAQLEREAETDPELRERLRSYAATVALVRNAAARERAPRELVDRVMAAIETSRRPLHPWLPWLGSGLAAAGLVGAWLLLSRLPSPPLTQEVARQAGAPVEAEGEGARPSDSEPAAPLPVTTDAEQDQRASAASSAPAAQRQVETPAVTSTADLGALVKLEEREGKARALSDSLARGLRTDELSVSNEQTDGKPGEPQVGFVGKLTVTDQAQTLDPDAAVPDPGLSLIAPFQFNEALGRLRAYRERAEGEDARALLVLVTMPPGPVALDDADGRAGEELKKSISGALAPELNWLSADRVLGRLVGAPAPTLAVQELRSPHPFEWPADVQPTYKLGEDQVLAVQGQPDQVELYLSNLATVVGQQQGSLALHATVPSALAFGLANRQEPKQPTATPPSGPATPGPPSPRRSAPGPTGAAAAGGAPDGGEPKLPTEPATQTVYLVLRRQQIQAVPSPATPAPKDDQPADKK